MKKTLIILLGFFLMTYGFCFAEGLKTTHEVTCQNQSAGIATQLGKTVIIYISGFFKQDQVAYSILDGSGTDNYKIEFTENRILQSTLIHLTPLKKGAEMKMCILVGPNIYVFYILESDSYIYYDQIKAKYVEIKN